MAKLTLSNRESRGKDGKREIFVEFRQPKELRPRFKSGVFVDPAAFHGNEDICYIDINVSKKQEKEALEARRDIISFIQTVDHLIAIAKDAKAKGYLDTITKTWLDDALSLNLKEPSFIQIQDAFEIKRRAKEAQEREKAEEAAKLSKKTIYFYIDEYCRIKRISQNRIRLYQSLKRILRRFELFNRICKKNKDLVLYPEAITKDLAIDFKEYIENELELSKTEPFQFDEICNIVKDEFALDGQTKIVERGGNRNAEIIKMISSVVSWLVGEELVTENPFRTIDKSMKTRPADPVYLSKKELDDLACYDLSTNPKLDRLRDYFVFQCVIGSRYGDLCRLTHGNIQNNILSYTPSKTAKHDSQVLPRVPLVPRALSLIDKYKSSDFDQKTKEEKANTLLFNIPPMTTYNDAIKEVFKKCGLDRQVEVVDPKTGKRYFRALYECASSHMARRTFAGITWQATKDPNIVCKMTGHAEGSKAFFRYRAIKDEDLTDAIKVLE